MEAIDSNLKAVHMVIWGQCSEAMQSKLKSVADFEDHNDKSNCIWLLNAIRGVIMQFEGQWYLNLSLREVLYNFTHYWQYLGVSLATYLEEDQTIIDTLEHYRGHIGAEPGLLAVEVGAAEVKKEHSQNKVIALGFLDGTNKKL